MSRIRVDPDKLWEASVKLAEIAERFRQLEQQILQTAMDAPSYDGQFGPRVRQVSDQGAAQMRKMWLQLTELSEKLDKKAKDFQEADVLSAEGMEALAAIVARQWCPIPLMDPDALWNHAAYGGVAFGKGPFPSSPSIPSQSTYEGYTTDPRLIALKAAGLIASLARKEANFQAVQSADPNVTLALRYARYENGIVVKGMRLDNHSSVVVANSRAYVHVFAVSPDGGAAMVDWERYTPEIYIEPGEFAYIEFGGERYPPGTQVRVQVNLYAVEYERQFRFEAWLIDATTGEAIRVDPSFFDE